MNPFGRPNDGALDLWMRPGKFGRAVELKVSLWSLRRKEKFRGAIEFMIDYASGAL